MGEVKFFENHELEQLDRFIIALEDTLNMIQNHTADRDIEVSGYIFPDGHGSLLIHLG